MAISTWVNMGIAAFLLFIIGMWAGVVRKSVNVVILSIVMLLLGIAAICIAIYQLLF